MAPIPADLLELVRDKQVLVTVGSGGVGKTTAAAVIGLLAARLGRRTLVLTIDPARRLASSLGLDALDHREQKLDADKASRMGIEPDLFHATMLDQHHAFDEMLRAEVDDPAAYQRISENAIFREMSSRLAGGQEYAAMEKLYQLATQQRYDLIVLDTPPTTNAIDFLEAPKKLAATMDGAAARFFTKDADPADGALGSMIGRGAKLIMGGLSRFVGASFIEQISQFFRDLGGFLSGFRERAERVTGLLRSDASSFVIVTSADARATQEAVELHSYLTKEQMACGAVIVNRVHPYWDREYTAHQVVEALDGFGLTPAERGRAAVPLIEGYDAIQAVARGERLQIDRLRQRCGKDYGYYLVPQMRDDVYDADQLAAFAGVLASADARLGNLGE